MSETIRKRGATMAVKRWIPRKPNKQFVLYFFSFFLVILLPGILLSLSSYKLMYSTILDEIRQGTSNAMKQTGLSADRLLLDITTLSVQLGLDGKIYTSSTNVDDAYLLNEIRDRISALAAENGYVQAVQIYFRKNNLILSSGAPNRQYANQINDGWIRDFSASGKEQLWLPTRSFVDQDGNVQRVMTLVRKFPVAFPSNTGYVAIHIFEDRFYELLQMTGADRDNRIYLADSSGALLSSFPRPANEDEIRVAEQAAALIPAEERRSWVGKFGGQEALISIGAPLQNGWTIVSVDSLGYLEKRLDYIRRVIALTGFLLVALGAVISFFLSRSMYNPIKLLFEKTKRAQKELALPVSSDKPDSLVYVSGMVDQLIHRHRELEAAYEVGHSAIVDRFLYQLFYNRVSGDLEQRVEDMRLPITPQGFIVIIVELDGYAELRERYSANDLNLLRYATHNIVQEVVSGHYVCLGTEIADNQIAVLANLESAAEYDRVRLAEMAGEIIQAVRSYLNLSATIGFGRPVEALSDAHMSFQQASDVIRRKLLTDDRKALFHENEEHTQAFQYFYPVQLEKSLMNNIRAGNEQQTRACLEQLKAELKGKPGMSHEIVYRVYHRLIDEAIDLVVDAGLPWENVFGEGNVYRELAKYETIESIHLWLEKLFLNVIVQLRDHLRSPSKVDAAIAYIAEHYREDISVEHIADAVQLNPAYLSRIFKQSTGKTVLEHMTLVRLARSKTLLCETSLNLSDIAQQIGYNNANSFIRFFRKYEGVTPGEFRKLQGQAARYEEA
ncbi:helix-turn-helix domain-containing protein [Paenibacillaceae bacterium WGS1546]|uniref:helix-turn-helix domain-containing protein n=1 Tax=Cohnella sp. WGS1546 TaxID=3366810 RepID=UPI00372D56D7